MKSEDITGGLDLLGDWLDAKGYTEEAGLCTKAMDEINRLYEWKDKAGDMDRVKTVELVDLRAALRESQQHFMRVDLENRRLREALNGLVIAVDWETTAIIGGADDVIIRAQILQTCARAAMGESDE